MSENPTDLASRYERLRLLYDVSQVIHSTLDPHRALQLILQEAVRIVHASSGTIVLVNPTTGFLEIQAAQGLPPHAEQLKLRVGEGITGWVARTGKPACVADVGADARYIMVRPEVACELAVPLEVGGEVRGVLNVDSDQRDAFTAADQELLQALASQAATVIQNTWLYEQFRLKAQLFESLTKVSQTVNSRVSLTDTLQVISQEACHLMGCKMCSIMMLDHTQEWLELHACHGGGSDYIQKPRVSVADSLLGTVIRRRKPLQVENVQISSRYQSVEVARREGLVSLLSVPLVFEGQALGTLNVYSAETHSYSNEEIRILSALADLSAIALEKARLYERIVTAEEQLRQSEKLSALGLLAAEVAHEIRNPLTVIKMLYHSLDLKFAPDDTRAKDAEIMGRKMEQLNRIVEQILAFARNAEPNVGPIDLNGIIRDLSLLVRHKLSQQKIDLLCPLAPDLPSALADAHQIEQVFLNVMLNAIDAMPRGGTLTITTRAELVKDKGDPGIAVEFRDTGEGMSPAQQERAFSSLLATTKPRGTGLGLAIVAKIVDAHRGVVAIASAPGSGTAITIWLPAAPTSSTLDAT